MKVFIMGMHRSGTSLITGLLSRCGLYVGSNLLMKAKDNPKGHYEERRFLNLNNQLLIKNGGSWHNPPRSLYYAGMKHLMKEFLDRDEWKKEFVGWKDPRICLTFPLWHELIYPEKIKIVYIMRSLEDSAQSLVARNGFDYRRMLELGRYYRRQAHNNLYRKGVQHIVTYFKIFFTPRWKTELDSICEFIGLEMPENTNRLEKFITPELNHFDSGTHA